MLTLRHTLAAASLVVAACSSDTIGDPAETSSGTETSLAEDPGSAEPTGDPMDASTTRAPRATLDPQRLETCTAEAALLAGAPDVAVTLTPTLGGCALIEPTGGATAPGEPAMLELNVLGGPSRVAEVVRCAPGQSPSVDFTAHSYATFTSSHRVSEDWRVVFAVDDGERIHVGVRLGRNCEAPTATTAPDTVAFDVAGRARSIVVHRCEPRSEPPQTPPVCP